MDLFLHGQRLVSQEPVYLQVSDDLKSVNMWHAWIKVIFDNFVVSSCLSSADNVSDKSIMSVDENQSFMIPCNVANLYFKEHESSLLSTSIILHDNIDGEVFVRSTSDIFNPTISLIWNFFCFLRADW